MQSTAVTDKQTAIYSLQRKLKSLKQQLETKDMHLGLMQRKAASLEEKLTDVVHKEVQWDVNIDRVSVSLSGNGGMIHFVYVGEEDGATD